MWFHMPVKSLCFAAALSALAAPAKADIACPADIEGARLIAMSLVHGNPPSQANLVPATTLIPKGYVNVWALRSSVGLVAVCRYSGGGSVEVTLPAGLTFCRVDSSPSSTTAGCR